MYFMWTATDSCIKSFTLFLLSTDWKPCACSLTNPIWISYNYYVAIFTVFEKIDTNSIEVTIIKHHISWTDYVVHVINNRLPHKILYSEQWCPLLKAKSSGKTGGLSQISLFYWEVRFLDSVSVWSSLQLHSEI